MLCKAKFSIDCFFLYDLLFEKNFEFTFFVINTVSRNRYPQQVDKFKKKN
jgi:hypothetical protein